MTNIESNSSVAETKRTPRCVPRTKLIAASDVLITCALPMLFMLSWFTPARTWPTTCRKIGPLILPTIGLDKDSLLRDVRNRIGQRNLSSSPDQIVHDYLAAHVERKLQSLRLHRPGSWEPSFRFDGKEHIDSALSRGTGVVLWNSNFAFAPLVAKIALSRAGFATKFLYHPSHGFDTTTRYGMRVLNRLICSVDDRYLDERVILDLGDSQPAIQTLIHCLNKNGVVGIRACGDARNPLRVPFLSGSISIAVGAPYLALKAGATLLPMFTLRDEDGKFLVTVEPELDLPPNIPSRESIQLAVNEYVERLTPYVERNPGEWIGWPDQ